MLNEFILFIKLCILISIPIVFMTLGHLILTNQ